VTELTVVKLGGSLLDDLAMRSHALAAIAGRWHNDHAVVVVHGGGKNIDAALNRLGIPKKTAQGLRVTDGDTLDVVTGVLAGNVNKGVVTALSGYEVPAAGISGADGDTLVASVHPPVDGVELGFVGSIEGSDPSLILTLMGGGFLPVVGSLAAGPDGTVLNVNADSAAAAIAVALRATRLVFLTDVEGLFDASGSLVASLDGPSAAAMLESPAVTGGMKPKLRACLSALAGGVPEVVIAGPQRHASSLAGGEGGTHVVAA
jgi:acetylglutamate kinase